MARIVLAPEIRDDFDRIFDFLFEHNPSSAAKHIDDIVRALDILQTSPQIGRPVGGAGAMRELVISNGAHGYLALYRFLGELDVVLVVAIRSQRDCGIGVAATERRAKIQRRMDCLLDVGCGHSTVTGCANLT